MNFRADIQYIIIPGYGNSGAGHWQSLWQEELPNCIRTEPTSWDFPQHNDWVSALDRAVGSCDGPVVLIAHSLGCITTADWALTHPSNKVAGALLVAIPDVMREDFPSEIQGYQTPLLAPLPFPSIAVLSSSDPYSALPRGKLFAEAYGSQIEEIGAFGHINHESGLGNWPEGKRLLQRLIQLTTA